MLASVGDVQTVPGMGSTVLYPTAYLTALVAAADAEIKRWCKQKLEPALNVEIHNGDLQKDIIVRERPLWAALTQLAAGSNGQALPQSTINVVSTAGFPPTGGVIGVQTGTANATAVAYTGVTPTSFTGCTGGTGTLSTASGVNAVFTPVVYQDPQGYGGTLPTSFGPGTQLVYGRSYLPDLENEATDYTTNPGAAVATGTAGNALGTGLSNSGLIRKAGVDGVGWWGLYPAAMLGGGKLGGYPPPSWQRGEGNLKVIYASGYSPVPADLNYACVAVVCRMARIQQLGGEGATEALSGYNYSLRPPNLDAPEFGEVNKILRRYREPSC